ncbi:FdrA protein [Fontibacillus phaseoli]|uniref:FdrA protein n=1 Tax=Fontibacillus phaseoli TaxID=1416533 RepID=A0A369B1U6_9BACL|nr:acyl-CoA synthetase FdrA [Fontibacillus phaseoli]RCX14406.1 FdrA protein [Fontibacillus phaseoli]
MLHIIIKPNLYQDSVSLMLMSNKLSDIDGVNQVSVMMGTPANIDIMKNTGMYTTDLDKAAPSDLCIAIDAESEEIVGTVLEEVEQFLKNQATASAGKKVEKVRTWDRAMQAMPEANLAVISIPGKYAADEAMSALENGLHVFMFSDNVAIEEEKRVKDFAKEKGLLVMGPDCGTAVIGGVPIAFSNIVSKGNIGVVGASGTGIQEVITLIDKLGAGISHAIGTGGRDLSESIEAVTMLDGIRALADNADTEVVVVISKPPAPKVREQVVTLLANIGKPVVAIFMGEKPESYLPSVKFAHTLEEAAILAVELAQGTKLEPAPEAKLPLDLGFTASQTKIRGLYTGGTLAYEAATLMKEALQVDKLKKYDEGYLLQYDGHEVIDLGDDMYTQGRPHPMIDGTTRFQFIEETSKQPEVAVVLFDLVLGYGAHEDMAASLSKAIKKAISGAASEGRKLYFVGSICGTKKDPQNYDSQLKLMLEAGAIMTDSNFSAVRTALRMIGHEVQVGSREFPVQEEAMPSTVVTPPSDAVKQLLDSKPKVINIGLSSFADNLETEGSRVVQFDWRPVAGGNEKLRKILSILNKM